MRQQSIVLIIGLVCLSVVAATTVNTQSSHRFFIDIPFQFAVRGETLPAGRYAVERIDPTKPNVVIIKLLENGIALLFITQRVENDNANHPAFYLPTRRTVFPVSCLDAGGALREPGDIPR